MYDCLFVVVVVVLDATKSLDVQNKKTSVQETVVIEQLMLMYQLTLACKLIEYSYSYSIIHQCI